MPDVIGDVYFTPDPNNSEREDRELLIQAYQSIGVKLTKSDKDDILKGICKPAERAGLKALSLLRENLAPDTGVES